MIPASRSAIVLAAVLTAQLAPAQTVERISVSTQGEPANHTLQSVTAPSADGRFVVFSTVATNLHEDDQVTTMDMFLRDRQQGTTTLLMPRGIAVDLTADARFVSYTEFEKLPGGIWLSFARLLDRETMTVTELTSVPHQSHAGPISGDGRYVIYNRNPTTPGGPAEVWRHEIATGVAVLVSETMSGTPNTVQAVGDGISHDGSIVTFTTQDPNMVPGDSNGMLDAMYRDFGFGSTERYSLSDGGQQLQALSEGGPLTPDTRFLVFDSNAPNVVPGDTNGTFDLFVADRFLGGVRCVSVNSAGEHGNGSTRPAGMWISADGASVLFDSDASNLVRGDANQRSDLFERDLATETTRRVVMGLNGAEPTGHTYLKGSSPDGRYLTFQSTATNLVRGAPTTISQAYIVDRGPQCLVTSYCASLPNSTGSAASIQSTGSPSLRLNNFVLAAVGLPDHAACLFFHGTSRIEPAVPFGDGLACAGGTRTRLGTLAAVGGVVIQFQDLSSTGYAAVRAGDVRRFQLVYRDPAAGGTGFNSTNALEVTFCP